MRKKSIISILICILILLLTGINCCAEDVVLYHADFNDDTIDDAPSSVYAFGMTAPTTSDIVVKSKDDEICADILRSKYMTSVFEEQITKGVFCVQFDTWQSAYGPLYCCLLNADNYEVSVNSASCMRYMVLSSGSTIQSFSAKGYSSANAFDITNDNDEAIKYSIKKWNHFEIVFDMDAKTMQFSVNGQMSKIFDCAFLDNPIGAINFYNGGGNGAERFVDNVKVYIPDNKPEVYFVDYNGDSHALSDTVVPMIEKIKLEFLYPLSANLTDSDLQSITLADSDEVLTDISCVMSEDRKTVYLGLDEGALKGNTHYTLTLPGDAFNHGDDVYFEFSTSELTEIFEIVGMSIETLSGDEIEMPSCGEEAKIWIQYLKNGDIENSDAVLVCTMENDRVLVGVQIFDVEFDSSGKVKIEIPIKFSDLQFDFVGIYLWDRDVYTPLRCGLVKGA